MTVGPSGDPGERLRAIRERAVLAALDSEMNNYPPTLPEEDREWLLERVAELERERDEAREVAEASAALHAEDALPGGKVFSDAYARWVTAVEAWTEGAALRAGG